MSICIVDAGMLRSAMVTHLFISYVPEDRRCFDELERHLRPLHAQGRITYWHMGMVPAGNDWRSWRREHLEQAQIILCLISADYLAQEQQGLTEIWRHQRAGAQVIPVLVKPALLEGTPFEALEPLPAGGMPISLWQNQDQVLLEVVKGILKVLSKTAVAQQAASHKDTRASPCDWPDNTSKIWIGRWSDLFGFEYSFKLMLRREGSCVSGAFEWTLIAAPRGSGLSRRIGRHATEQLKGSVEMETGLLDLEGIDISDKSISNVDIYALQINAEGYLAGKSRSDDGKWQTTLTGNPVGEPAGAASLGAGEQASSLV